MYSSTRLGLELLLFAVCILRVLYKPLAAQDYIACLPNSYIPSYRVIHELILFLEIRCGSTIYLTYFHCPHVRKHSLKALYLIFTLFHSIFLQFLTGFYLQKRVQEVLLTSTCSDWFQKDGAGLALQTF